MVETLFLTQNFLTSKNNYKIRGSQKKELEYSKRTCIENVVNQVSIFLTQFALKADY